MHKEEVDLLQKRAKNFFKAAMQRFNDEDWDLTCFLAEQSAQLILKAIILEKSGETPRTHSIRKLNALISKITKKDVEINRNSLKLLESAYLNSRYFNIEYEKEDAEEAIKITEVLIKFVEDLRE